MIGLEYPRLVRGGNSLTRHVLLGAVGEAADQGPWSSGNRETSPRNPAAYALDPSAVPCQGKPSGTPVLDFAADPRPGKLNG